MKNEKINKNKQHTQDQNTKTKKKLKRTTIRKTKTKKSALAKHVKEPLKSVKKIEKMKRMSLLEQNVNVQRITVNLEDVDDTDIARDVLLRTSSYFSSLSSAEQKQLKILRRLAQGYDDDNNNNDDASNKNIMKEGKTTKNKNSVRNSIEPIYRKTRRSEQYQFMKQKEQHVGNRIRSLEHEHESDDSSSSSSEPSWLTESDEENDDSNNEDGSNNYYEVDNDELDSNSSSSNSNEKNNKMSSKHTPKGGIFQSNDDLWKDEIQ